MQYMEENYIQIIIDNKEKIFDIISICIIGIYISRIIKNILLSIMIIVILTLIKEKYIMDSNKTIKEILKDLVNDIKISLTNFIEFL